MCFLTAIGYRSALPVTRARCLSWWKPAFVIGLNFLALCQAFADFRQAFPDARLQRLHFISFENSHCGRLIWQQRTGAGRNSPPYAKELLAQWPLPLPGCHRLLLVAGRITLDL